MVSRSSENIQAGHPDRRRKWHQLIWIVGLLLLATLVNYFLDGDRALAVLIFGSDHLWPGIDRFPWNFLYDWAPVPGFILVGLAIVILAGGFLSFRLKKLRREAVFILLLMALGPGLIVNVLLKDQLGRARPREIIECGGSHQYTEIWEKGTTGANSSFPSGHASVAFFTLAPWFIFRGRKENSMKSTMIARSFLAFGIVFGSAVGLARMLQGGHFLNDVIWAGGIVYLVGGVLALFIFPRGAR